MFQCYSKGWPMMITAFMNSQLMPIPAMIDWLVAARETCPVSCLQLNGISEDARAAQVTEIINKFRKGTLWQAPQLANQKVAKNIVAKALEEAVVEVEAYRDKKVYTELPKLVLEDLVRMDEEDDNSRRVKRRKKESKDSYAELKPVYTNPWKLCDAEIKVGKQKVMQVAKLEYKKTSSDLLNEEQKTLTKRKLPMKSQGSLSTMPVGFR